MTPYKPDLNEKISIRMSVETKGKLRELCRRSDLDEALVVRLVLEAGMGIAQEQGLPAMLEKRAAMLSKGTRGTPAPKVELTVRKKGVPGTKWEVVDKAGKVLGDGPLYNMRPLAKKLCPPGGRAVLIRENGEKELLS